MQVDIAALDFSAQRSRIALKNPRVRPPKDPRSLLHMPSVDPTPSSHLPVKVPAGLPLGGLGIGIKLPGRLFTKRHVKPLDEYVCLFFYKLQVMRYNFCLLGLGAGFPVLKKTQHVVREENRPETSQVLLIMFGHSF